MGIREINCTPDSNIERVAYDDATSDLFIQFARAGTSPYRYKQVPTLTAEGFEKGEKATFYARGTIFGQFITEKVPSIPDPLPDPSPVTTSRPPTQLASSAGDDSSE